MTKIERFENALLAITGSWDVGTELRAWWKAGAAPGEFPNAAREDKATLIVFRGGEVFTFSAGPYPMPMLASRCAFGSGRDFAEAAMHLGKSAVEAVEIACLFQYDCGMGIDALTLESEP